jgi:hypothetical protein
MKSIWLSHISGISMAKYAGEYASYRKLKGFKEESVSRR